MPELIALRFCNTNILAIDKIFYHIHCANQALEKMESLLKNEVLFDSPDNCLVSECKEELNYALGEAMNFQDDKM